MREFIEFCRHMWGLLVYVRAVFVALIILLLCCALGIAFVENMAFGDALYFTLITGLTIGYGDLVPVTAMGRALSVVAGVIGLVVIGLVVAVATRALAQAADEKRRGSKTS